MSGGFPAKILLSTALRNLFKTIGVAQASRQEIKTICEQYEPEKPMNITNPLEGLQSLPEVANEFNRLYEELKANAPDYTQAYLDTLLAGKKGKTWDYARPTAFSDLQPCPLVDPVLKYGAQLKVGCVWNLYYWRMVSNYSFEEIKEGDTVKGLRLHRQGAGYGDYLLLKDGRILHSGPAMTVGTDGKGAWSYGNTSLDLNRYTELKSLKTDSDLAESLAQVRRYA